MSNYSIVGNLIMSTKSGKEVADLTANGEVVMRSGMQGAHSKGVQEFIAIIKGEGNKILQPHVSDERSENLQPYVNAENIGVKVEETVGKFVKIEDIPQSMLPRFDKILGIRSPELVHFVKEYNLSDRQQRQLVQRLEK